MFCKWVGEEVENPQQTIPIAIIASVFICFLAYAGVSSTVTLLVPYFLLSERAPVTESLQQTGIEWANYIVYIGACSAFLSSLFGILFIY